MYTVTSFELSPIPGSAASRAGLLSCLSVQDINISLWRLPEKVKLDKTVFMNQGEWELLGVLTQFREFSLEDSSHYAEMKFYVSGTGVGTGGRPPELGVVRPTWNPGGTGWGPEGRISAALSLAQGPHSCLGTSGK